MQIAERRKLVSSIRTTNIDSEGDEVPYNEKDNSFPGLDATPSGGNDNNVVHDRGVLSSGIVHSTVDSAMETVSPAVNDGFAEDSKEAENDLYHEKTSSKVDSHKQLKDITSESVWSDELPSFLSSSSATSSLKDEKLGDLKESSLQDVNGEANMPTSEDVKPPPLAGANVMNVIIVSAECAPWSKTGTLP